MSVRMISPSTPRKITKVCFFGRSRSFLLQLHPYERRSEFDLHGLEDGAKPTFPFPRFVTRRPAIIAVSFKSWSCSLSNSEYFLLIDLNLQYVQIAFQMDRFLVHEGSAIFSRRTICWSFNSSICSVVIWNLLSYSPLFYHI